MARDDDEQPQPLPSAAEPPEEPEPVAWLGELIRDRPESEREDFLVALLLNAGFDVKTLSVPMQALLERFAVRASLVLGPAEMMDRQIAAYFELHPIPPALIQAFERAFRAELLARDPAVLRAAVASLGGTVAQWRDPSPAAEGSHSGGALGYFAARAKFDKR